MAAATAGSAPPRRPRRPRVDDPTTKYARDVVARRVVACKYVRQACARHLQDLETGRARGLHFDRVQAERAIGFIRSLKHTKGKASRGNFNLRPWQAFIVGSIFGWRRKDGRRRFSTAYVEIPRKQGKSELAAAIALYAAFFDDPPEFGAEAYVAATKKDQARIVFNKAKSMLRRAPAHRRWVRVLAQRLMRDDTEAFLAPLGADADTLDGLDPAIVVIDELHAHRTPAVVNVMESATGARDQALQIEITTAGNDQQSICFQHHEYSTQVLDPESKIEDDEWFAVIYTTDEGDAWDAEDSWRKAMPNLDVSVPLHWVQRRCKRARSIRSSKNEFLQKVLNHWVNVGVRAIDLALWDAGKDPFDVEELRGRECWVGLDVAGVKDLSSAVALFPPASAGEKWKLVGRHWCPEENIEERSAMDRVPYAQFVEDGYLVATPGNVTDHDVILEELLEYFAKPFKVHEMAYDPALIAPVWITRLQKAGLTCVPHSQLAKFMMGPTREFLRLYEASKLQHGGDPVMRWTAGNLVVRRGQMGDTAPDKLKSRERIDPMVAAIMAAGRAVLEPAGPPPSIYDERGLRTL